MWVTGEAGVSRQRHRDLTSAEPIWALNTDELAEILPDQGWTAKRAEHIGVAVRKRLSHAGVPGLTRDEVGDPVGNALNHNLMLELVSSATLVPPDLRVLDELGGD